MAELVQKLGLKEGHLICLLEAPDEASQIMEGILPPSTSIHTTLQSSDYDMILIWPLNLEGLDQLLARLQEYIKPNGAIWAIIPKQKYARQRGLDFNWQQLQAAALTTNLVDNKTAAFSEQDYATRFVIRKSSRRQLDKR